jgi:glycosyltransferase involved in cell wall biosynthesis
MRDGFTWPKISIVTPSYNQGVFLEETIRSVLIQGYPNLEYFVMDGGSTDDSVKVIRKYEDQLTYWVSNRDGGQAAAIAKGFRLSSGTILGYLNSDDILLPGSLEAVGTFFATHRSTGMIVGKSLFINGDGDIQRPVWGIKPTRHSLFFWGTGGFCQPATFWLREAFDRSGGIDTSMRFSFDYDFYMRLLRNSYAERLNTYLAAFRIHGASKTFTLQDVRRVEDDLVRCRNGIDKYSKIIRRIAYICYEIHYRLVASFHRATVLIGMEKVPGLSGKWY